MFLSRFLRRLKEYDRLVNIKQVARRYFVMNAFDGVLTALGILIGTFLASAQNTSVIISATIGAAIALGVSGVWSGYLTEHAERRKELKELEGILYTKLGKTKFGRATEAASLSIAIVNGLSPVLAVAAIIMPFFFAGKFASLNVVYYSSFAIAFSILIALGLFLGKISKESIIKSVLKTISAGIICTAVIIAVEQLI